MVYILFALMAGLIFYGVSRPPFKVSSHWDHYFPEEQFQPTDFYDQVQRQLEARQLEGVRIGRESFMESHVLSGMRVYERITWQEYIVYIGVVPISGGTFVSWWLCVKDEYMINKIPVLNKLFGKDRKNKTFFQKDTEKMYLSSIHSTILDVIDGASAANGRRGLVDVERMYKHIA